MKDVSTQAPPTLEVQVQNAPQTRFSKRKVLIAGFLLTLAVIVAIVLAISARNASQIVRLAQPVDLQKEYQNPFITKPENPFESYENPFENLK